MQPSFRTALNDLLDWLFPFRPVMREIRRARAEAEATNRELEAVIGMLETLHGSVRSHD